MTNPNDEELLILPDDDSDISFDELKKDVSANTEKPVVEKEKAQTDGLITFDDEPVINEVKDAPKVDITSKLDALDEAPVLTLDDTPDDKLGSLELKTETVTETKPEITLDLETPIKTETLASENLETPTVAKTEVSLGLDLTPETPKVDPVETPKPQNTESLVDMSALLGDEETSKETAPVVAPVVKTAKTESLAGLMDEVEVPTVSHETATVVAQIVPQEEEVTGTMGDILEKTIKEFQVREDAINTEIEERTAHIEALQEELDFEKEHKAELEKEHKAIEANRKTLEKMKDDYEKSEEEKEEKSTAKKTTTRTHRTRKTTTKKIIFSKKP